MKIHTLFVLPFLYFTAPIRTSFFKSIYCLFQAASVLESEPIQHAAQMQEVVNNMQAAAAEVKVEADAVSIPVGKLSRIDLPISYIFYCLLHLLNIGVKYP